MVNRRYTERANGEEPATAPVTAQPILENGRRKETAVLMTDELDEDGSVRGRYYEGRRDWVGRTRSCASYD